jgi:hypothetical protein
VAAVELTNHPGTSITDIRRILDAAVSERQRLRVERAGRAVLEANRLAIVYWQSRLGKELARAGVSGRREETIPPAPEAAAPATGPSPAPR